jgi:hypothetical protein
MANTTYEDVIKSFHTTFQDKVIIPEFLELEWFKKSIGKYTYEIDTLVFDEITMQFDKPLDRYIIDTLGLMMKKFYQERELSKVNKRISIVGNDISIDGNNGSKTATKNELEYISSELDDMLYKQTPSAYN